MKKATNAESLKRREAIKEMLADGYSRGQIVKYCGETWGIKVTQVDQYIAKCNEEFEEAYKERADKRYGRALKRTTQFYLKMKRKGNDVCAASALKELNDIEGVKISKTDHTSSDGSMTQKFIVEIVDAKPKDS